MLLKSVRSIKRWWIHTQSEASFECQSSTKYGQNEIDQNKCQHNNKHFEFPVLPEHLVFNRLWGLPHIQRQCWHGVGFINQNFNFLTPIYKPLKILVDNLIDLLRLLPKFSYVIHLLRCIVQLRITFKGFRKFHAAVHVASLSFVLIDSGCEQFFYLFEVAEGDSFGVRGIAHDDVCELLVEDVEDVIIGCVFDVFAGGGA